MKNNYYGKIVGFTLVIILLLTAKCNRPEDFALTPNANVKQHAIVPLEHIAGDTSIKAITQFLSDSNNRRFAVLKAVSEEGEQVRSSLGLIRLGNPHSYDVRPIVSGQHMTNIISTGDNGYELHESTLDLEPAGTIALKDRKFTFDIDGSGDVSHLTLTPALRWSLPLPVFTQNGNQRTLQAMSKRNRMKVLYHKAFDCCGLERGPKLLKHASGMPFLFLENEAETYAFHPKDGSVVSIRPLDSIDLNTSVVLCDGGNEKEPLYVTWGTAEELRSIYLLLGLEAKADVNQSRLLLLRIKEMRLELVYDLEIAPDVIVSTATLNGTSIWLGGTLFQKDFSESLAWMAEISPSHFKQSTYRLRKSASISAIKVNPKNGQIYAAGSDNFSRARLGSADDMSGFVLELAPNHSEIFRHYLNGPRTTKIITLDLNSIGSEQMLWVGGKTDGPNTHSADRHSDAFLYAIPVGTH